MERDNQKTLGLVITDGVGYRNFILSDFMAEAVLEFDQIIIFSGLPSSVYKLKYVAQIRIIELPIFVEPFKTWFWRKFKEVAHLQLHKRFFGINDNLRSNKNSNNSNRGKATRFIYGITKLVHSERFIQYLEAQQQKSLQAHLITQKCKSLLEETGIRVLFFTHQRPPYVVPLVTAAQEMGISKGSFIFSWDNLASKGRMAFSFDYYLVWSELMKKDLKYFYPSTDENKISIVGTPQFEPYVMVDYLSDLSSFQERFKLEKDKKTICFSCGDISTSKNDELYIKTIARAIEEKRILEPVNLLIRTSPAEEPDRFFSIKEQFPFIKWNYPEWLVSREEHPEPWSQRVPSRNDLKVLREVLSFSDLNINMCSTMSLDFMLFDKPVINTVFGNEENGLYNDQRFLKYAHYSDVVESGAVRIARNEKDLVQHINFYLATPSADSVERKKLLELQIGKPLIGTSKRIINALKFIS